MTRPSSLRFVMLLSVVLAVPAAADSRVDFSDPGFVTAAGAVPAGERLRVEGVPLPGWPSLASLELKRFEVFAPDARIVVHGSAGEESLAPPSTRFFRGYVEGWPLSTAYMSIRSDGEVRGILANGGRYWILGNFDGERRLPGLVVRDVPDSALAEDQSQFSCGTGNLGNEPGQALRGVIASATPPPARGGGPTYTARLAIETDNEFLGLFAGSTTNATNYIGDLLGFASGIYAAEVDTDFFISFISLWTVPDPWAQTNPTCGLFEFGRHWNDNYGGMAGGDVYTLSHFMSGKNNGGGVAWVGVLCSSQFNYDHQGTCSLTPQTDNYGGPYGYSGDMDGNFNVGNPSVVWDIVVVSHEIGHNFDSPHTHCYAGLQGNPNPIDECFGSETGCYSGATSLPSGCPGAGQGCGTIMSYCHLLGGGISNIELTLGTGHPFGIAPERVPSQISDHVVATAGLSPACLAPLTAIFADGFESGNTSAWSAVVP